MAQIGVSLVLAGLALLVVGLLGAALAGGERNHRDTSESKVEGGAVVFIGPIPIVFGSNKRVAKWMIVLAVVVAALLLLQTIAANGV